MAKSTAPLLSFSASGQIGQTQVYSKWKGRGYVRRHVIPGNPQTAEQTLTRNAFSFLQQVYKVAPPLFTDVWTAYARGLVMTSRNGHTKINLGAIRNQANLNDYQMSPGALGGLPPTANVVTPGVGTLSGAISVPGNLPQGWTITSAIMGVIRDQDPDTGILYNVFAVEDVTAPYVCLISGLSANLWQVFAWLKWLRPDGQVAYSPAIRTTATPT